MRELLRAACWEYRHGVDGEDGGLCFESAWGRSLQELAAFAIGFISYIGLTLDSGRANAGSRAEARDFSVSGTIHPKMVDLRTASATSGWDIRGDRAHLAEPSNGNRSNWRPRSLTIGQSRRRRAPPSLSGSRSTNPIRPTRPCNAPPSRRPSTTVLSAIFYPPVPRFHPHRWRRPQQPCALRRRQFLCRVRLRSDHPNPDFSSPVRPTRPFPSHTRRVARRRTQRFRVRL